MKNHTCVYTRGIINISPNTKCFRTHGIINMISPNTRVVDRAKLRSDCGTENTIIAAMQCPFRLQANAHFYGTSPAIQRIESWWSQFRKNRSI